MTVFFFIFNTIQCTSHFGSINQHLLVLNLLGVESTAEGQNKNKVQQRDSVSVFIDIEGVRNRTVCLTKGHY